jgi:hypothetical protein
LNLLYVLHRRELAGQLQAGDRGKTSRIERLWLRARGSEIFQRDADGKPAGVCVKAGRGRRQKLFAAVAAQKNLLIAQP